MKRHLLALATGAIAIVLANPVVARDNHGRKQIRVEQNHNNARNRAIQNRAMQNRAIRNRVVQQRVITQQRQSYSAGFRDGVRAGNSNRYYSAPVYYSRAPVYYSSAPAYASYGNGAYWWGSNGRIDCRRSDGTVGTIVGAIAGGTLGNMIAQDGNKTMGALIGGSLGALLGNEIAKGNARCY